MQKQIYLETTPIYSLSLKFWEFSRMTEIFPGISATRILGFDEGRLLINEFKFTN